jgi:hypothetical protein
VALAAFALLAHPLPAGAAPVQRQRWPPHRPPAPPSHTHPNPTPHTHTLTNTHTPARPTLACSEHPPGHPAPPHRLGRSGGGLWPGPPVGQVRAGGRTAAGARPRRGLHPAHRVQPRPARQAAGEPCLFSCHTVFVLCWPRVQGQWCVCLCVRARQRNAAGYANSSGWAWAAFCRLPSAHLPSLPPTRLPFIH